MTTPTHIPMPPSDFRTLSAKLGKNPLRVQGPGGNTSIKMGAAMWIKASGTELAHAESVNIFVAVDRAQALKEAHGEGDGTCKDTVLDKTLTLRPSIETTFHALFEWPIVAHTHSVATLTHAISAQGLKRAEEKLAGLPFAIVPYRKPGINLTQAIADQITPETQIVLLGNHGLIIAGNTPKGVEQLMDDVEKRLDMPVLTHKNADTTQPAPEGYEWLGNAAPLACDPRLFQYATSGSYYPDHVVFLGPALPTHPTPTSPAMLIKGVGVAIKTDATSSQLAMSQCLCDVLSRLPTDWEPDAIGQDAEHALLNWDAEKYRQALAARGE